MTSTAPTTQWDLLGDAARGDRVARESFVARYSPFVGLYTSAVAGRLDIPRQDQPDLVQDVFYEIFKDDGVLARVDPKQPRGFRAYLRGVCRNVVFRAVEKRPTRELQPETGELDTRAGRSIDPKDLYELAYARLIFREIRRDMQRAATGASGDDAVAMRIFEGRYFNGHELKDVAFKEGRSYEEAKTLCSRMRKQFEDRVMRRLLEIHGGDDTMAEDEFKDFLRIFGDA